MLTPDQLSESHATSKLLGKKSLGIANTSLGVRKKASLMISGQASSSSQKEKNSIGS